MRPHKTLAGIGLLLLLAACTAEQTDRYWLWRGMGCCGWCSGCQL